MAAPSHHMLTLEISLVTMRVGQVSFLFLVAALALDVGSPRLA
jgi:hypothetical protein